MGELLLVGAVVVHLPDFFRTAAIADEINLALGDAGDATAKAKDDLVGEAVGNEAGVLIGRLFAVLLAQHLGQLRVLGVIEPALYVQISLLDSKVAKDQHAGVGRRVTPSGKVYLLRRAGDLQRKEAARDHVENPGILQVVRECGVESHRQVLRAGVVGDQLEVRHRQANFLYPQPGAGANPGLGREQRDRREEEQGKCSETFHPRHGEDRPSHPELKLPRDGQLTATSVMTLPFVIKPKLYGDVIAGVFLRQWAEGVDSLQRA